MQYKFVRKKQTVHPAVPNSGTSLSTCLRRLSKLYRPGLFKFLGEDHKLVAQELMWFFLNMLHSTKSAPFSQVYYFFIIGKICFAARWNVFANQICPVGCSADNPDIDYEKEWWQNTQLLKSNSNAQWLWFNSVDRYEIFWTGIHLLDGQQEASVNTVLPQHTQKLFTRNLAIYFKGGQRCVYIFGMFPRFIENVFFNTDKKKHMWFLCVLSNILIVAISVGLPVVVNNPVSASQVGFQQFRAVELFCVEGSRKAVIVGTPVMISNFLLTVISERHFRIFAN